jgi:hypothetical protein
MWPNSGNRYYAEAGGVEMVDAPGEWFVDRKSGVLTYCAGSLDEDPNAAAFVLDRGGDLKEGVLVESAEPRSSQLSPPDVKLLAPVTLNASAVAWGASSFVLVARFATPSAATGQQIFFKGPSSHAHVPDDKALYIANGALALDIGWVGHLAGGKQVCDGAEHAVALHYDLPSSTYYLWVDGALDGTASFGAPDPSEAPADWVVQLAAAWGAGGFVSNVSFSYSVPAPVSNLHFEGLSVQHVRWSATTHSSSPRTQSLTLSRDGGGVCIGGVGARP